MAATEHLMAVVNLRLCTYLSVWSAAVFVRCCWCLCYYFSIGFIFFTLYLLIYLYLLFIYLLIPLCFFLKCPSAGNKKKSISPLGKLKCLVLQVGS